MKRAIAIFLATAGAASAHPGHGEPVATHWLTEADHLIVLAALGLMALSLGVGALAACRQARKDRSDE